MARKKVSNTVASPEPTTISDSAPTNSSSKSAPPPPPTDTRPILPIAPSADEDRDDVKVNNASASELKTACDDALKRFLSRPDLFKQIYLHTDVRLALGWAGVFIAAGTAFYGYRVEFEQSKPVVWVGLILYLLLTTLQTLYAYFIEGDVVFVGKRKTFDKRIVTERVTISSRTIPSTPQKPPSYALSLSFVRSSNGGKSLLGRSSAAENRSYTAFFDEQGTMDQHAFESWVGEVVGRAMESAE
ncbi:microsomal signal peptidase 25 kDa subunit-domain-containing protein [Amylostereum chailletii]|nr:microsomal signal peptidase 25 kDa subunit-domain-containing protein [Amylostereum chailletii]